ncbi:MBL fold metallo-hydrolase [Niveispirillum sp. KHB5.9]|uniref:MBL fold metallo-hydrolase n=1 Tax=Niveispirillum sp. KHB5.9 TaxID=3400269 RepID=UPI003A8805FE
MRNKALCALVLLLPLTGCGGSHLASLPYPPGANVTPADGYLYEGTRLAPGVWLFASPEPFHVQPYGNVTAVEQADGFVLFDSGGTPAGARRILDMLAGLSSKPVKAVVVSHWHGDHVNGLRAIRERWPKVRLIATNATRRTLTDPRVARFMPSGDTASDDAIRRNIEGAVARMRTRAAQPDLPEPLLTGNERAARELEHYGHELQGGALLVPEEGFDERLLLDDPDRPVELRFLGQANTDGDAVAWLPKQHILLTGDILVAPIPYGYGGYPREWETTLQRLKSFDFKAMVPGHGPVMRDSTYIDRLSALIAEVRARVAPLVAAGLSLDDVQKQVELSAQAQMFSGGDPWRSSLFDQYWRQPIIASAFKEAKGDPIIQGGG